jgi:hypothetical protein
VEAATWYQQNSNAQQSNRDDPDQGALFILVQLSRIWLSTIIVGS